jgi:hypothetical protein
MSESRHKCEDYAPAGFVGHWREWHRGHGCNLDPSLPLAAPVREPCSCLGPPCVYPTFCASEQKPQHRATALPEAVLPSKP